MHKLHATSMKARAEFHYGAIAFMYGMLMWMATEADGLVPAQRFGERRRCELTHRMPQRDELLSVAALALGRQVGRAGR